jgi:hypothetical protein
MEGYLMPIDKRDLQWKEYFDKEKAYRKFILEVLHANPDKAYTFLELCGEVHKRVSRKHIQQDAIFEGNIRAALQDPSIAIVFHEGETYYTLKDDVLLK